jgi:hypothetical protein
MEAEKIIIYLTPFVLGVNLNIIIFEDNEEQIVKSFSYKENNLDTKTETKTDNNTINLINRKEHYELYYTSEQYNEYSNIFKIYEYQEINNNFNTNFEQSKDTGLSSFQNNDKNKRNDINIKITKILNFQIKKL